MAAPHAAVRRLALRPLSGRRRRVRGRRVGRAHGDRHRRQDGSSLGSRPRTRLRALQRNRGVCGVGHARERVRAALARALDGRDAPAFAYATARDLSPERRHVLRGRHPVTHGDGCRPTREADSPVVSGPLAVGSESALVAVPVAVLGYWLSLSLVFAFGMAVTVALVAARSWGPDPARSGWNRRRRGRRVGRRRRRSCRAIPRSDRRPRGARGRRDNDRRLDGGGRTIRPTLDRRGRRATDSPGYDVLPVGDEALVAKTLLDLSRSSGGVWKPFVSAGILLALVAALVGVVAAITGIEPSPGIFFGGVLGLSAFTTYNWLTEFDSLESYLVYPSPSRPCFGPSGRRSSSSPFPPSEPYLAAVVWFEATLLDAVVGAALLGWLRVVLLRAHRLPRRLLAQRVPLRRRPVRDVHRRRRRRARPDAGRRLRRRSAVADRRRRPRRRGSRLRRRRSRPLESRGSPVGATPPRG